MNKEYAELAAAFQRVLLEVTGCSPGEYSTWAEEAEKIIEEVRILKEIQWRYRDLCR